MDSKMSTITQWQAGSLALAPIWQTQQMPCHFWHSLSRQCVMPCHFFGRSVNIFNRFWNNWG